MEESFIQYARPGIFVALLSGFVILEWLMPRRKLKPIKIRRRFTNLMIIIIDSIIVKLLFKSAAVGAALWVSSHGYGLFNVIGIPYWLVFIISFLVLDFSIWFFHVASHKIPALWRFHRMHHSDVDIDASTGVRFHPVEMILSMCGKIILVVILGAPALCVLTFETVLNGSSLFNHSNIKIPLWLDRILRLAIVTPDMHRVHHSVIKKEHNANYGFNLSIWDQIFSTYVDQPEMGHDKMTIGLKEYQTDSPSRLKWSLIMPFRK